MLKENELSVLGIIKYILNDNEKDYGVEKSSGMKAFSDRNGFSGTNAALHVDVKDWSALFRELKAQSLLPITYPWAKKRNVPSDIMQEWTNYFAAQSYQWYKFMEEQKKLLELLSEYGYPVAIIKGASNSINFPQPQLRVSRDIDFLVRLDDYENIYKLLIQSGYTLSGKKKSGKHHVALRKNSISLEMHKRPGGTRVVGKYANQNLIDFFQKGLEETKTVTCGKYVIPILPELQNAMVLLLHSEQHMREGLGLRQILDWMMFVKEHVDDGFWYDHLEGWAKAGHVDRLARIMTRMCQKYLGLSSDITWCRDADESACDQLMEYVFQQGDFGTKALRQDKEVRLLTETQNAGGFWRRLNKSSLYSMPAARKHKTLKPIAIVYQLFRYMVKWMNREHPVRTFFKDKKTGKERAALFRKLGLRSE